MWIDSSVRRAVLLGLALLCVHGVSAQLADHPDMPAKLVYKLMPQFPASKRPDNNKGDVLLEMTVTADGVVVDPVVITSSHPEFEQAILDAVLKWRFEPATQKGEAVAVRVQQRIFFDLKPSEGYAQAEAVFSYAWDAKGQDDLPEILRYDTPPVVKQTLAPVYPFELLRTKVSGSARVAVLVGPDGAVWAARILDTTQIEFGLATKAMLLTWTYEPATRGGRASWSAYSHEQIFAPDDPDSAVSASARRLLRQIEIDETRILDFRQLDAIPKQLKRTVPVYPRESQVYGIADTVTVEFFVDTEGQVQLPRAIDASNQALAWSALTAVARWRFEPPKRRGKPVDARASISISFKNS